MKKRCLVTTIALALLLALPSFAAEVNTGDAEGTVSFENLAARVQSSSPMLRAYDELISAVDEVDRATAYADLVEANNNLVDLAWAYLQAGDTGTAWVLQERQEQLKEQLDAYKPGNYPRTYADLVKPIQTLRGQLILGAENLYFNIAALEQDIECGRTELNKLERTASETQLLYSLGRASAFACEAAKAARDSAAVQLDSLIGKSELWKMQLQLFIGEEPTGRLTLAPVPEATQFQLDSLQYDADLKAGMESSYDLYLAENAVADAKEEWEDAEFGYQKRAAEHKYNAAVYTFEAKKQSFQQSFDAIYRGLTTAQSTATAAKETIIYQQKVYDAAELYYKLGMISKSAFLTAESNLAIAKSAVQTANIGLAAAYNSCCRARLGLISGQT